MVTLNMNPIRIMALAVLLMVLFFTTCTPALAQQHVIANKNVTRPEIQQNLARPALINILYAENRNGYNEIHWNSRQDQDVKAFIIEFSTDGLNFESAGQVPIHSGLEYTYQHYIQDTRPMLYRINMQLTNMRNVHTDAFLLEGIPVSPVRFYPTIISGNSVNIESQFPLERVSIVSTNGSQVYSKELNGQSGYIPVVTPTLSRGMYIIHFIGRGWQTSEKLIVS